VPARFVHLSHFPRLSVRKASENGFEVLHGHPPDGLLVRSKDRDLFYELAGDDGSRDRICPHGPLSIRKNRRFAVKSMASLSEKPPQRSQRRY
jgi:hypothetical protein